MSRHCLAGTASGHGGLLTGPVRAKAGAFLGLCTLLLVLPDPALGSALKLEAEVTLPGGKGPYWGVNFSRSTSFIVDGMETAADRPVLVCSYSRNLLYFDTDDLRLFRELRFSSIESPVPSGNGRYVFLTTWREDRRSGNLVSRVRMEDWLGRTLWDLDASFTTSLSPTPRGGLVVLPDCEGFSTDFPSSWMRLSPPISREGLMIIGSAGDLLLRDPLLRRVPCGYHAAIDATGRYLVFAYGDRRDSGPLAGSDCVSIGLYDIEQGTEVWRKRLSGSSVVDLAVGPGGARIICFTRKQGASTFLPFLLSTDGEYLLSPRTATFATDMPVGDIVLSPGGGVCAFTVTDNRIYVLRMDDGEEIWSMNSADLGSQSGGVCRAAGRHPSIGCRSISDNGTALVSSYCYDQTTGERQSMLWMVDPSGEAADRFDSEWITSGGYISQAWILDEARSLLLIQGKRLAKYSVVPDPD